MATTILKVSGQTADWFINGNDVMDTFILNVTAAKLLNTNTIANANSTKGIEQGAGWRAQVAGYCIGRMIPEGASLPGDFQWSNVTHVNVRAYVRLPNRLDDNHEVGFFFGNVTGTFGTPTYEVGHTNYTGTVVVPANAFSGADPAYQLYESGNVAVSIPSTPAEPAFFIDTVTNSASMANDGITVEWDAVDVVLTYTPAGGSTPVTATPSATGTVSFSKQLTAARSLSFTGTGGTALSRLASLSKSLSFSGSGSVALARPASRLRSFAYSAAGAVQLAKGKLFTRLFEFAASGSSALSRTSQWVKSLAIAATGTPAVSRTASFLRSLSATASGSAAVTRAIALSKSITASGSLAFIQQLVGGATQHTRDLVLSGIATASLTLQVARQRAFAFTATGASAMTKGQVFLRNLAFNASGAASTLVQQLVSVSSSMTATGTALLARTHHWTLAFGPVAAGTAAVQKLVGMSRGFAASGATAFTSLYATAIGRAYSATGAVSRTASLTVSQVRSVAASGSVALRRAIGKMFNYIGRATVSLTGDGITPPSGRGILRLLVRTVLRDKTRDR